MLQLAAMVSRQPAALPVQFIAFGAEEPRGSGDATAPLRLTAIRGGSVALGASGDPGDGVARSGRRTRRLCAVCTASDRGNRLRDAIRAAARQAEIPTRGCTNFASDHWSFAKAGIPAVRLGSIPYAGYHSRGDIPRVVNRRQLDRVGRTVWAWLLTLN